MYFCKQSTYIITDLTTYLPTYLCRFYKYKIVLHKVISIDVRRTIWSLFLNLLVPLNN